MTFALGRLAITANAKRHMDTVGANPLHYLMQHHSRNWGELCEADKQANNHALKHGGRILSRYSLPDGEPIYIISEADRSVTTILLVSDY